MSCLPEADQAELAKLRQRDPFAREVLSQLEAILTSHSFERLQEKGRDCLDYLVSMKLLGRSEEIKEVSIAIAVWKETTDYDPKIDNKVRVACQDLRGRLQEYYATEGKSAPIGITIETRTFVPKIEDRRVSIAVGQFENWNPNGSEDHLCLTLRAEIAHQLECAGTIVQFDDGLKSDRKTKYALRGTLSLVDGELHVHMQLYECSARSAVFDDSFVSRRNDLLKLCRQASDAILSVLTQSNGWHLKRPETPDGFQPTALYRKGRMHLSKRTQADIRLAIDSFEKAIEINPNFARAYSGLADCLLILSWYEISTPDREWFAIAKRWAQEGLMLNRHLHEIYASLGYARLLCDFDWNGAEQDLRHAIRLENRYPDAHHRLANLMTMTGRFPEAEQEIQRAFDLDRNSVVIRKTKGDPFYYSGSYSKAINQYRDTLKLFPNFWMAHLFLGLAYEQDGDFKRALTAFEEVAKTAGLGCTVQGALGHLYAQTGRSDDAHAIIQRLLEPGGQCAAPHTLAVIYAGLGDKDRAFAALDASFENRIELVAWIKVDPRFANIRDDSRFNQFLQRVGLA